MKTIVINADPRIKRKTGQIMKSAAEGAKSTGAELEYVDLYKLDLRGCMNCSICKKKNKEIFKCYWRDDLSPLIERILNADTLLIGSRIFFNEPTSHYRALIERLIYCVVSFDKNYYFKGKVDVGIFYTTEVPRDYFDEKIRPCLKQTEEMFKLLNGDVEVYTSYMIMTTKKSSIGEDSLNKEKEEFEKDLENAFEIGARLSKKE